MSDAAEVQTQASELKAAFQRAFPPLRLREPLWVRELPSIAAGRIAGVLQGLTPARRRPRPLRGQRRACWQRRGWERRQ